MGKELTDGEILSNILEELNYSANKFAIKLGYKSSSSIYHILNGENNISTDMAKNIVEVFPKVNFLYVTMGELPILLDNSHSIGQNNFFESNKATFDQIPQVLKNIEDLLIEIRDKMNE